MAPKRPSPLDEPPTASSLEEEETSSGEEEEDASGEEEEEEVALTQRPKKSTALPSTLAVEKKAASNKSDSVVNPQAQSSSSESRFGSDFDSDTESERNVKTIASKPTKETTKVKKPRSKPSASTTPARSSLKRPSETTKDAKRAKKGSEAHVHDRLVAEDDSKTSVDESKKLFQRLWSEEDEIVILNGMIDYKAKKGADPASDMNAFHDFIRKSLHIDVTKAQLMDKIRRLKKKYKNNADRGKKGAEPTFSKPHEQKGFELSRQIWGGEGTGGVSAAEKASPNGNSTPKKNQRSGTSRTPASQKAEFLSSLDASKEDNRINTDGGESPSGYFNGLAGFDRDLGAVRLPERFLKRGLELIGKSQRTELEEEWKKLHLAELELFVRRTELIRDQVKLILEAYKSSDK